MATAKREIAFIDTGISDLETFLAGLRSEIRAIVLDPAKPALAQIAIELAKASLRGQRPDAIHVVAHGRPGEVSFASGPLSLATIGSYRDDLAIIGQALGGGEIRLWTCETAKGAEGAAFVTRISRATGARVVATTGLVGSAARSGSWQLDAQAEPIYAPPPLSAAGIESYAGVMATKYWRGGNGNWSASTWATTATGAANTAPPAAGDTVILENLLSEVSASYTLTVNSNTNAIASLQIGDGGNTNSVTLVIASGVTLDVAGAITVNLSSGGSNTAQIQMSGTATLDAATLNLTGTGGGPTGLVTGSGTLNVSGHITTGSHVTASGGTLDVFGTIDSGAVLAIGTAAASTLKLEGTATSSAAISINNANQTLEIGATAVLTISAAESITNGTIQLDGGTLTDASGVTIGSGARLSGSGTAGAITLSGGTITQSGAALTLTSITGSGTVNGSPTVTTVTASGNALEFTGAVDLTGSATAFHIANVANSVLKFDGAVGTASINPTVTFDAASSGVGILDLTGINLSDFHGVIANLNAGESIKINGAASDSLDATGTQLTVFNGSATSLGTIDLSTSYTGYTFSVASGTISLALSAPAILHVGDGGAIDGADDTVSGQTNDNLVTGTAGANSTVTILDGATQLGTTTAAADGSWSYTLTSGNITTIGQGSGKSITAKDAGHGLTSASSSAFTFSVDTTAPTLSASLPLDNASTAPLNRNIVLDFSEDVFANGGTITLTKDNSPGAGTIQTFTLTAGSTSGTGYTISGSTIVLNPTADLVSGGTYHITASATALVDAAGNAWAGISSTLTLNWTATAADATLPATPTITSVTDDVGSIQGALANNAVTDDTQLVVRVSFTADPAAARPPPAP